MIRACDTSLRLTVFGTPWKKRLRSILRAQSRNKKLKKTQSCSRFFWSLKNMKFKTSWSAVSLISKLLPGTRYIHTSYTHTSYHYGRKYKDLSGINTKMKMGLHFRTYWHCSSLWARLVSEEGFSLPREGVPSWRAHTLCNYLHLGHIMT